VLRHRLDCGGRLFTAKFGVVVHYLLLQLLDHLLANDAILLACQFCDGLRDRVGGSTDGPVLLKYRRHQAASAAKPSAAPET